MIACASRIESLPKERHEGIGRVLGSSDTVAPLYPNGQMLDRPAQRSRGS